MEFQCLKGYGKKKFGKHWYMTLQTRLSRSVIQHVSICLDSIICWDYSAAQYLTTPSINWSVIHLF